MKKKITSLIIAAAVLAASAYSLPEGGFVTGTDAAGKISGIKGEATSNLPYVVLYPYDNTDKVEYSYIYQSGDNTVTRVEYNASSSSIVVEEYNMTSGKLLKSYTVEMELELFGGFFSGKDYNYFVFGSPNMDETGEKEVIRVVRYSKSWKRNGYSYLKGINTQIPFDAGSCRMEEKDGLLYIFTCHTMFKSGEYNHQANMGFVIDQSTMKFTEKNFEGSYNTFMRYSSHSFDQHIAVDEGAVYTIDHGDAYPRCIRLHKLDTATSRTSDSSLFDIPGDTGENYTGIVLGDMELTEDNVVVALKLNSKLLSGAAGTYNELRDICIMTAPKDKIGSSNISKIINLTNYTEADKSTLLRNSVPRLVKISDNRFIVLWKEGIGGSSWWSTALTTPVTRIAEIDGSGNLLGEIVTTDKVQLSDSDPILCTDGLIRWFSPDKSGSMKLYTLDPDDKGTFKLPGDINGDGLTDLSDLTLLQKKLAGWGVDIVELNSNVNDDTQVDISDLVALQKYIAGWDVALM